MDADAAATTTRAPSDLPQETLSYFVGDDLRARVFIDKYALRDPGGPVLELTPPQMWRRIARELASVEATPEKRAEWEQKFYWLLDDFRFVPGGRIMHGAGNPKRVTLLNCYVCPVKEDSIEAIFEWMKEAARTYSMGGGVGTDISVLRPRGAHVNNAARSSTGSVSFMELFSLTTGTIGQSGRRGALMITISDSHPDVLDFVKVKRNLNRVRFANISVRVSDGFMKAVEADQDWKLYFRNDQADVTKTVKARELWAELIRGARDYAEPGLIFWDQIKRWSTSEYNGMNVITTNPCSEIPLEPYGNCCLGNVNLAQFVRDPFESTARVDWDALEPALRYATRFLDNVLDYNADKHPLPQQRAASLKSRRIGVGFTGLGDMLIKLGLKYDTDEAVAFADQFFDRVKNIVYDESVNLAQEKGVFPAYDGDKHLQALFLTTLQSQVLDRIRRHGLRNVALLTVPPVGSGAALAGVTSGIEPIFDVSYIRRSESLSQETFKVYHPLVREYMARFGVEREEDLPPYFVTAHQIKAEMRVKMQAAIQKHIDHSISSTVNLPKETTPEEVERIYFMAWKMGCKGITVYRAGSRENILTAKNEIEEKKPTIYTVRKEILEDLYHGQRKSLTEISQLFGTNVGTVHRVFTRMGIERRRPVEAADEIATKSIQLSESAVELIEGELLGDGSLRRYKNGATFTYTTKHYDYAVWLSGRLEREGIECSDILEYQHDAGNVVFKFQTLAYKELGDLHDRWYDPQGSKRLPPDFVLTPVRLRQWFIGDGSNVTDSKAKYIACYSAFSPDDKALLKGMLEKTLGRSLVFHEGGNKVYINADVVKMLFDVIGPCPVTCYEYKWKGGEHVMYVRETETEQLGGALALGTANSTPVVSRVEEPPRSARTTPRSRPKVTIGRTERVETPRGRIYVVVNEDEWGVCEVFVHSFDVEAEACGRLASLSLRAGVDPREVIEQLWRVQSKEVAFDRSASGTVVRITTIAQAVALALGRALYGEDFRPDKEFPRADVLPEPAVPARQQRLKFASEKTAVALPAAGGATDVDGETVGNGDRQARLEFIGICPDCGEALVHENGCANCRSCGYSRC